MINFVLDHLTIKCMRIEMASYIILQFKHNEQTHNYSATQKYFIQYSSRSTKHFPI